MVMDFNELRNLCHEELVLREYEDKYRERLESVWDDVWDWLQEQGITEFAEEIGNRYCEERFGTHLMPHRPPVRLREKIRAVRMLICYQKSGTFEFRSPNTEYIFTGCTGTIATEYLEYCRDILNVAEKTVDNKKYYLHSFCSYLNLNGIELDELSVDVMEDYFSFMNFSLASRHNASSAIRIFLRYAYDTGKTKHDCSVYVLKDDYKKNCKVPTTYEEDEIRSIVDAVERASSIGKRDYLVLLLATEYGWRAKDITEFSFDSIDWDQNIIRLNQHKTDVQVEYPLLSNIGNAIIDYLKYARPKTEAPQIIVSHENANKGKPLSTPMIHSIVTKYMKRAGIKNWKNKKHGPHAMRHSLATNLLKKNVAMPVISIVLGHQKTETTMIYISVDYDKLKQCALPMPTLHSPFYMKEGNHGKV